MMIRRLTVLCLFFIYTICISAQIQRTFWGFELGVSTKSYIVKELRSKGKKIRKVDDDSVIISDMSFGGLVWPTTILLFYKNKLYYVTFSMSAYEIGSLDALNTHWDNLSESLSKKYSRLCIKYSDTSFYYSDFKTDLMLFIDYERHSMGLVKYMTLLYYDRKLESEKYFSTLNEL